MTWPIGVSTGCCTERPIADALHAAARAGLTAVELGTPPRHFDPLDAAQVDAVRRLLAALGVHARSLHAPFGGVLDLSNPDEHQRHAAVDTVHRIARTLHELGGDVIVVHPSDVARHTTDPAMRLECAADALGRLERACRAAGVRVAMETTLPHLVGGHPDEVRWLLARLDVGVCLDTGHVHLGHHLTAMLDAAGGRLIHVHVHDNRGTHDDHLAPGEGAVNWASVFAGLITARYSGHLMLELHCPGPALAAHYQHASQRLRQLLAQHARAASDAVEAR
jgi:sugar phosphate isomerase/epimerase